MEQSIAAFRTAKVHLIKESPFLGRILLLLNALILDKDNQPFIPIAAVNYDNLYLQGVTDPETGALGFDSLSREGRLAVLAHELFHIVFLHPSLPSGFVPEVANLAQDVVINRVLGTFRDTPLDARFLPEGCVRIVTDRYVNGQNVQGFVVGKGSNETFFPVDNVQNADWVEIYYEIMKSLPKECTCNRKGECDYCKSLEKIRVINPLSGDVGYVDPRKKSEYMERENYIRAQIKEAADKSRGSLPGEVQFFIDQLFDSKVPWHKVLRNLIKTEVDKKDFSWYPPNFRRLQYAYLPTIRSESLGDVYVVLDTSGSMSETEMAEGLSEFRGMRRATPFRLHFLSCDSEVSEIISFEPHEEPDWQRLPLQGRGGTSFIPAFEAIEEHSSRLKRRPAIVVYFTDTFGDFPKKEPDYPVIWVVTVKDAKVPWGKVLSVRD